MHFHALGEKEGTLELAGRDAAMDEVSLDLSSSLPPAHDELLLLHGHVELIRQ